jgi:hypothetical protein
MKKHIRKNRAISGLLLIVMLFALIAQPAIADPDPNVVVNGDIGGGGDAGGGTDESWWKASNQDEGVRVTVVDITGDPHPVGSSFDITNHTASSFFFTNTKAQFTTASLKNPSTVLVYGGNNKLNYRYDEEDSSPSINERRMTPAEYFGAGGLATSTGAASLGELPRIIKSTTYGQGSVDEIKDFFMQPVFLNLAADKTGITHDEIRSGDYKLILEPIIFMVIGGEKHIMTATETGYWFKMKKDGVTIHDTILGNRLPLSMFLDPNDDNFPEGDLGFSSWGGSTTATPSSHDIINTLGLWIITIADQKPADPKFFFSLKADPKNKEVFGDVGVPAQLGEDAIITVSIKPDEIAEWEKALKKIRHDDVGGDFIWLEWTMTTTSGKILKNTGLPAPGFPGTSGTGLRMSADELLSLLGKDKDKDNLAQYIFNDPVAQELINENGKVRYDYTLEITITLVYDMKDEAGAYKDAHIKGIVIGTTDETVAKDYANWFRGAPPQDTPVTEIIEYTSNPDTYAEIKQGEIYNEMWEAMAGVPTTRNLYFAVGGSEFIVDMQGTIIKEQTATRTYNARYNSVDCEYKIGDQAKSYTFASPPSGFSGSTTITSMHDGGTLTVTATGTTVISAASWTDHSQVGSDSWNDAPYEAAMTAAQTYADAINNEAYSYTSDSDKFTRIMKGWSASVSGSNVHNHTSVSVGHDAVEGTEDSPDTPYVATTGTKGTNNSWTVTVTWTVGKHANGSSPQTPESAGGACGPCCEHVLPAVDDSWVQEFTYDYLDFDKLTVWRLDEGRVTGMGVITGGSDIVKAATIQGQPNIFYNIADTETSKDGRFRYSLEPEQHDDVFWDMGDRDPKCDTRESYGGGFRWNGTTDRAVHGTTGSNKNYPASAAAGDHSGTDPAGKEKSTFNDTRLYNETDSESQGATEYIGFSKQRNLTTDVTSITDYLILQTSSGDQAVEYYEQKSDEVLAFQDFRYETLMYGTGNPLEGGVYQNGSAKKEIWDDNPKSAAEWTEKSIHLGSYNGKFTEVTTKYDGLNTDELPLDQEVGTIFDDDPAKTVKRPKRPTNDLYVAKYGIDIVDTNPNGEYLTGIATTFWQADVDYNPKDFVQPFDVSSQSDFGGQNGYTQNAPYSPDHDKVNDIVVHDPVSTEYAMLISLPEERDQRIDAHKEWSSKLRDEGVNKEVYCPGSPELCDFRYLNCTYTGTTEHTAECYLPTTPRTLNAHFHGYECIDMDKMREALTLVADSSGGGIAGSQDFEYKGYVQEFKAPHTGTYTLEVWGAQGGKSKHGEAGGEGGYAKGDVTLTAGQTIYVYVGGAGSLGFQGGWNGGGNGANTNSDSAGGGGGTDIRTTNNTTYANRLIVAGGGGGSGCYDTYGGAGGGLTGGAAVDPNDYGGAGKPGTQNEGGKGGKNSGAGTVGKGGSTGTEYAWPGAGGGGGYYGGGAGGNTTGGGGAGGGGSGYIGGVTNGSMKTGGNTGNGKARITWEGVSGVTVEAGSKAFAFSNSVQPFTAPHTGTYTLEVWGAQGGVSGYSANIEGGRGGYSKGQVALTQGQTIYITVGGQGGFNGGGAGDGTVQNGGGATHIATNTGLLSTLSSARSAILLVAGGGGGSEYQATPGNNGHLNGGPYPQYGGGSGGGTSGLAGVGDFADTGNGVGGNGVGGTQTTGYSFGAGGPSVGQHSGGGGGGYFGGYAGTNDNKAGGGGSGYIGGVTNGTTQSGVNSGNGKALISWAATTVPGSGGGTGTITENLATTLPLVSGWIGHNTEYIWEITMPSSVTWTVNATINTEAGDIVYIGETAYSGSKAVGHQFTGTTIKVRFVTNGTVESTGFTISSITSTTTGTSTGTMKVGATGTPAPVNLVYSTSGQLLADIPSSPVYYYTGTITKLNTAVSPPVLITGYVTDQPLFYSGAYYTHYAAGSTGSRYVIGTASGTPSSITLTRPGSGEHYKGEEWGLIDLEEIAEGNVTDSRSGSITSAWMAKQSAEALAHILKCDSSVPNRHVCDDTCQHSEILICNEPHHEGRHYSIDNTICWSACGDDSKHQRITSANTSRGLIKEGTFVNLDWGFSIYYPNIGDFYQGEPLGIPETTAQRGKSFVDQMDCTEWLAKKRVKFEFDVIFCGINEHTENHQHTSECRAYKALEWIDLTPWKEYEYYHFYVPMEEVEAAYESITFESVAINAPGLKNDGNRESTNRVRYDHLAAKHGAERIAYTDVVGRIGNSLMVDTGDWRFSNLFKTPVEGNETDDWYVQGVVKKVDTTTQNFTVADTVDIRGIPNVTDQDVYGQTAWIRNKLINFPLTPSKNNIQALKKEAVRVGYPLYMSVDTLGRFYNEIGIQPYYYWYDPDTDTATPIDVYEITESGAYKKVTSFYGANEVNFNYALDWDKERERRNITETENERTRALAAYDGRSYPVGDWYPLGHANLLYFMERARTYYGTNLTRDHNQNLGDRYEGIDFTLSAKRWHYTLGLPSSSVYVDADAPATQENLDKYKDRENGYVLVACTIYSFGDVWSLKHKVSATLGGVDGVIAVFDGDESSRDDLTIRKTH